MASHSAEYNGAQIDPGFTVVTSGAGSVSFSGGMAQISVPAETDAAAIVLDQSLAADKRFTLKGRARANSANAIDNGVHLLQVMQKATAPTPGSHTAVMAQNRIIALLRTGTDQFLLQYTQSPSGPWFEWNHATQQWSQGGGWQSGVVQRDRFYTAALESSDSVPSLGNVPGWRILIYDENEGLIETTTWVAWSNVYNSGDPLWAVQGEINTTYAAYAPNPIDHDYFRYEETTAGGSLADPAVTLTPGVNRMGVSWNAVAGATSYTVRRAEAAGGPYVDIVSVAGTSFEDTRPSTSGQLWADCPMPKYVGLARQTRYYYTVIANGSGGNSPGANETSAVTVAASKFAGGPVRGKILQFLIVSSTYNHMRSQDPTLAEVQHQFNWYVANISSKITFVVGWQYLFPEDAEEQAIQDWLVQAVAAGGHDIVTSPHNAWYPNNPTWTYGIANELQRLTDAHNKCVQLFGKAPITAIAWHTNKDIVQRYVDLGYRIGPTVSHEIYGVDGLQELGPPFYFYRPSKRATTNPGSGNLSDTFDIIGGLSVLQWGLYRMYPEPLSATSVSNGFGTADLSVNLFQQQHQIEQLMEDSQALPFTDYAFLPIYMDDYWFHRDSRAGVPISGEHTENEFIQRQNALWLKDRYDGTAADIVTLSEFVAFLESAIPPGESLPANAYLSYNDWPGQEAEKQLRYDCEVHSSIGRWKVGGGGHVRLIQHVPYSPTYDEPATPSYDWLTRPAGTVLRIDAQPTADLVAPGGTRYALTAPEAGHAPVFVRDPVLTVNGETAVQEWEIYDSGNIQKLAKVRYTYAPTGFSVHYVLEPGVIDSVDSFSFPASVPITVEYANPPSYPPIAPDNVVAAATDRQVAIAWSMPPGATGSNLYWRTAPGVTKDNSTMLAGVTSPFVHQNLKNGQRYYYAVSAENTSGESDLSAEVSAMPVAPAAARERKHRDVLKLLFPAELAGVFEADIEMEGSHLDAVGDAAAGLLAEFFPDSAYDLLPAFERVWGLTPAETDTVQQRRNRMTRKFRELGGLSIAYFTGMAETAGFSVHIKELHPFWAGWGDAGDELLPEDSIFVWRTIVSPLGEGSFLYFRAGSAGAGEYLAVVSAEAAEIESLFQALKPAHTLAQFEYL